MPEGPVTLLFRKGECIVTLNETSLNYTGGEKSRKHKD